MRLHELPQLPAMDTNDVAVHPQHDANAAILLTATGTNYKQNRSPEIFLSKTILLCQVVLYADVFLLH